MTFTTNKFKYGIITTSILFTLFSFTGTGLAVLFCGYVILTA